MDLSRLAVYTHTVKNNQILAALHFLLEENSLEEVMLEVKHQYGNYESELQMKLSGPKKNLPPIFRAVNSNENVLLRDLWEQLPKEKEPVAYHSLLESIARCTKRQISLIRIMNQKAKLLNTFGRQFGPETNFYVVEFVYNSRIFPFAVTATRIQK